VQPSRVEQPRGAGHRLKMVRELTRVAPDRVWREAGIPPRLLDMYDAARSRSAPTTSRPWRIASISRPPG